MPVSYFVTDRGRFVEFVISGKVAGDEIVAQKRAMALDPTIVPGHSELCDATGVTSVDLKPDFMEEVTAATRLIQKAHRNSRTAIVVSRPDLFDLSRQFERIVASLGITVIVFNHRDTALLWLGRWQPGTEWWRQPGRQEESQQGEQDAPGAKPKSWGRKTEGGKNGGGKNGGAAGSGGGSGIIPPRAS
jgi:hypothetical protein